MKLIYLMLSAVAISLSFTACQKEYSSDNIVPSTSSSLGDSTYLEKVVFFDSIGGVRDTFYLIQYTYDNLKRVTDQMEAEITSGIQDTFIWQRYFYNATDTLPEKAIILDYYSPNQYVDSGYQYYKYDQYTRRIFDSTFNVTRDLSGTIVSTRFLVNTIQYINNKIYGFSKGGFIFPSVTNHYFTDTATTDANGNVISTTDNVIVSSFTYDNNPCPYARLSNFRTLDVFALGETESWEMQHKNNRLKAYEYVVGNFTWDDDLTGKYIYRKDGYPLRIVTSNAPGDFSVVSYVYKKF